MSRSPNIRHQFTLFAIAITVGIAALQPPPHASAQDCPTPRTLVTTAGPTTVIDPALCELTLTEGARCVHLARMCLKNSLSHFHSRLKAILLF